MNDNMEELITEIDEVNRQHRIGVIYNCERCDKIAYLIYAWHEIENCKSLSDVERTPLAEDTQQSGSSPD